MNHDSDNFFLNSDKITPVKPSPSQDLISLYGLRDLANSVARIDASTGKKRKLRKSYKGHIQDLPGKSDIPTEPYLQSLLNAPESTGPRIAVLDQGVLRASIGTIRVGPIPGFDVSLLGLDEMEEDDRDDSASPGGRKAKKRKYESDHKGKKRKKA